MGTVRGPVGPARAGEGGKSEAEAREKARSARDRVPESVAEPDAPPWLPRAEFERADPTGSARFDPVARDAKGRVALQAPNLARDVRDAMEVRPERANANEPFIQDVMRLRRAFYATDSDLIHEFPVTTNNAVELFVDGTKAFPALFQAIRDAKQTIHVSYYIFEDDALGNQMADALIAKAQEGREVRLVVDGVGSGQYVWSAKRRIIQRMEDGGVKVIRNHVLSPLGPAQFKNHPDHRKLVIIDGKIAFTGGMNVATPYLSDFHDVMVKVQGDAVQQMQVEWMKNWLFLGGAFPRPKVDGLRNMTQVEARIREDRDKYFPEVPAAVGHLKVRVLQTIPGQNAQIYRQTLELIRSAKKNIWIETPYCTNPEVQNALMVAALHGRQVHVILPRDNDNPMSALAVRSRFAALSAAGVLVHEFPGFNHGKVMVIDEGTPDAKVSIGSSNMDDLSFRHISELNLLIEDPDFALQVMQSVFHEDLPRSPVVDPKTLNFWDRLGGVFHLVHDIL